MPIEDEFGKLYVFQPLYDAYLNLGEPEATAFRQVLKDAGFTGFEELCDRARMLCYDIDSEYWEAHRPWAKATKKSISKPAPKFNDMVKSIRRSASGQIAKDDGALGKFRIEVHGVEETSKWFTDDDEGTAFVDEIIDRAVKAGIETEIEVYNANGAYETGWTVGSDGQVRG